MMKVTKRSSGARELARGSQSISIGLKMNLVVGIQFGALTISLYMYVRAKDPLKGVEHNTTVFHSLLELVA